MPNDTIYFDPADPSAAYALGRALRSLAAGSRKYPCSVTVVCIGTCRSQGDSYGPLTGNLLLRRAGAGLTLFGTFSHPVHALTLGSTLGLIDPAAFVIAVDASVGGPEHLGRVGVSPRPMLPGSGLGKHLPRVGDISVTGIAAAYGPSPLETLSRAPLGMVCRMARLTSAAISDCFGCTLP